MDGTCLQKFRITNGYEVNATRRHFSCLQPLWDRCFHLQILWAPNSAAASAKRSETRRAAPLSCSEALMKQAPTALTPCLLKTTRYKTRRL